MIEKRKKWNSGGVSDIIGNILVLAITVVLFSTIFVFVGQMPTPTKATYVDFAVEMEENRTSGAYNILNMTHVGGEELKDFNTRIYLTVDNSTHSLLFSDSLTQIGDTWRAGETALFDCSPAKLGGVDIVNASKISIMVITDNEIAWKGDVKNVGSSAPVIMDRWVDSDENATGNQPVMLDDRFWVYVGVKDADGDLNTSRVFINMTSLGLGLIQMTPVSYSPGDTVVTFSASAKTPANIPMGYYYFTINATDKAGHESTARMEVPIGGNIGTNPNLVITSNNIWVDPSNPTRGDDGVRVYVKIVNYGKVSTTFTAHVYDTKPDGSIVELGSVPSTIPAGGPETIYVDWNASKLFPSGNHIISATAELPLGVTDADPSDNTGSTTIEVMPKILVVDDDGSSLGSDSDTSSMILAALDSGDFRYDRFVVSGVNGPSYDSGLNEMKDYDIIIWDTGHETTSTLTATDETNLEKFMNNGGNLWLIGEDILNDRGTDTFIQNYIHVTGFTADTGPDLLLNGSMDSCLNGTKNVTTSERNDIPNSGDIITTYSTDAGDEAGPAMEGKSGINAVWYDNIDRDSRRVFFPFELSSVKEPALQAEITYKVLYWLGNISYRQGRDLSISEQTISPTRPFYAQPVTISAVVRNNGMLPEPDVEVAFWIDGQSDGTTKDPEILNPGESWRVNYTWIPKTVGTHSIIAEVDPYNVIKETNENNNRVSSYLASTEIYIQYRILVVDDDGSANNPGGSATRANVTAYACNALDSLGYEYELYVVPEGGGEDGPTSSTMDDYNAVLWFTGEDTNTITAHDQENLSAYLDGGGFLWLDSQNIINELGTSNPFVNNYLMVQGADKDSGTGGNIYGTTGDEISHGINFVFDPLFTDGTDTLIAGGGGVNILWKDAGRSSSIGVRYENSHSSSRTVFMSVDISGINGTYVNNTFTNGSVTREYLAYMIMHWFEMPDKRVEVMAAPSDIYISDAHPQLGESYVIRATVHNVGGTRTSALIRFMDDDTLVGSDSVYIAPGETTTAEVVWTPLFAGQRTITVQIDPIYEIPDEIFRFNDNPYLSRYVYFFWDDMENGSSKWQHESTIMLLNGENALDYFDKSTTLYTNITQDWDETMSEGLNTTTEMFHSFDTSYWLEEKAPGGSSSATTITQSVPIDVVFALDTSGSMGDSNGHGGTKWDDTKQAAENFINDLTDQDRAAIWIFNNNGKHPKKLIPTPDDALAYMTSSNKTDFINALEGVSVNGYTPFYDTLGKAIENSLVDDPTVNDNSRLEFVIGMTDGVSNYDDEYSPHANWGETTTSGGGKSGSGSYKGLINAPPMVFTIGLLDNKYHDSNYPTAPDWAHTPNPDPNTDSYHIEYDLWNCADSSLKPRGKYGRDFNTSSIGYDAISSEFSTPNPNIGHYYYTEDSSQLDNIFRSIREMTQSIASGGSSALSGNVTRSAEPATTRAAGTTGTHPSPTSTTTETRYMRSDTQNVNGLNAYRLDTTQSSSSQSAKYTPFSSGSYAGHWGIRVWKRESGGSNPETEITPGHSVAVVTRSSDGEGMQSATWTPPYTSLDPTDSIVIRVYQDTSDPPSSSYKEFTTGPLGATSLDPVQWTIHYYTKREVTSNVIGFKTTNLYFYWGDSSHNSRIEGFQYSCLKITVDTPAGGETWQGGSVHTITWHTEKGFGSITNVDLAYSTNGGSNWNTIATGISNTGSYDWTVPNDPSTDCYIRATVHDNRGESATDISGKFTILRGPPSVIETYPATGKIALPSQLVDIIFNESMDTSTTPSLSPDDCGYRFEGWFTTYQTDDTAIWSHDDNWTEGAHITITVSGQKNSEGTAGSDYTWSFDVLAFSSSSGGGLPQGDNTNKSAVTQSMDLSQAEKATLTFWHKYNIVPGMNGAVLEIGYRDSSHADANGWAWKYITPSQGAYNGNMNLDVERLDSFGNNMVWAWNGISGKGEFSWQPVTVNLLNYVPDEYRDQVRVKFQYFQYGMGTGYGWYLDDVKVAISRADTTEVTASSKDAWQLTDNDSWSGTHSWWNGNPDTGYCMPGIDNSLMTMPIDLVSARNATLSAYFKFNLNTQEGAPPDGFRVEVSSDNGLTWHAINLGVRSSWGVSGKDNSGTTSYTGHNAGSYWTQAGTLTRLNCDLSDWAGNVILIRFRMVTTSATNYNHYETPYDPNGVNFGGFYIDDVVVSGETVHS